MRNIAVFSTPCSAQAVRKLKSSKNPLLRPYQEAIRLSIAVFCTGAYQPEVIEEILIKRMDVARDHVKRLEISPDREWMRAVLMGRQRAHDPTTTSRAFYSPRLRYLRMTTWENRPTWQLARWVRPEGSSTIIIRSRAGDVFVRNAIQMNVLETNSQVDLAALEAASEEKDRRERARLFKDLQILMLDGLSDPLKRSEAIQQFVRLYRTPVRSSPLEPTCRAVVMDVESIRPDGIEDGGRIMKVIDAKSKDLKTTNGYLKKNLDGQPIAVRNARHLHGLAAGLKNGEVVVRGTAGDYVGVLNSGAKITVTRNAGNYAADNMTGGTLIIEGSAGYGVGQYCYGGTVVVKGNAGDFTGTMNKGGCLIIGGDVGRTPGRIC
jgi:hypothetical protein